MCITALIFCNDIYFPVMIVNFITFITNFTVFNAKIVFRNKISIVFFLQHQSNCLKNFIRIICLPVSSVCVSFTISIWKYLLYHIINIKILFSLRNCFSFQIIGGRGHEPFFIILYSIYEWLRTPQPNKKDIQNQRKARL